MPELVYATSVDGISTDTEFGRLQVAGDENVGFRPYLLMISSVAGCATGVFRRELKARGESDEIVKAVAGYHRNADEWKRIESIHLEIEVASTVSLSVAAEAEVEMHRTSSMLNTVKGSIEVTSHVSVHDD